MDDDEIVRQRLLTGATVVARGPSITNLTSSYLSFVDSIHEQSIDECHVALDKLMKEIGMFEFEVHRTQVVAETCKQEIRKYEEIHIETEQAVEEVKRDIESLSQALLEEKRVRKHKIECEALAKQINQLPTCAELNKDIAKLETEISNSGAYKAEVENTLALRNKQFGSLLHSIVDLQRLLKEDIELVKIAKEGGTRDKEEFLDSLMDDGAESDKEVIESKSAENSEEDDDDEEDDENPASREREIRSDANLEEEGQITAEEENNVEMTEAGETTTN